MVTDTLKCYADKDNTSKWSTKGMEKEHSRMKIQRINSIKTFFPMITSWLKETKM